jgi:hypothetical protein
LKYGRESVEIHKLYCTRRLNKDKTYTAFFISLFGSREVTGAEITGNHDFSKIKNVLLRVLFFKLFHSEFTDHRLYLRSPLLLLFFIIAITFIRIIAVLVICDNYFSVLWVGRLSRI